MNNYTFCAQWIAKHIKDNKVKVLDYGCGSGEIVKNLKDLSIDAYGCDIYYGGSKAEDKVDKIFLTNGIIKNMEDINKIPFQTNSFDIVVSNMVLEHVEDLDSTLKEFKRVLNSDGIVLSLFPDKGVWKEGHCGVWFLHWFPPNSKFRYYYAALFRIFGLGTHKEGKGIWEWSVHKCTWIDKWTHYRTKKDIKRIFSKYFEYSKNIEQIYLENKFPSSRNFIRLIPAKLITLFVNKVAFLAFINSSNKKRIIQKNT